jgi:phosphoglycolate phosphatase-like HAD superfamily hydrolase
MPLKIPGDVRTAVIRDWLNGKPRDTIAHENPLSAGAVSNIINEWRNSLTYPDADALRELGIILRKSGITAYNCATGFRLASILKVLGVSEETFRNFVSEIYNRCKDIGLQPEFIAYNAKQILDLSESIPISQIPDYILEKTNEKQKLEETIKKLGLDQLEAEASLQQVLNEKKISLAELEEFSALKTEFKKFRIDVEDVQHTIKVIEGVQKLGHNINNIVIAVSNWETSGAIQAELEKSIGELTVVKSNLEEECAALERCVILYRQKEAVFKELQEMGFGLKELKLLFYTIKEVAAENKISESTAVQKFVEDIETDYDNKLGYESKLKSLQLEIEKTNKQLSMLLVALASRNKVSRILGELMLMGFDDQQILNLAVALQSYTSNQEYLEADLNRYGDLKKSIEALNQQLKNTRKSKEADRSSK